MLTPIIPAISVKFGLNDTLSVIMESMSLKFRVVPALRMAYYEYLFPMYVQ